MMPPPNVYDLFQFRRTLTGQTLNGEMDLVSEAYRPLIKHLNGLAAGERPPHFNTFLTFAPNRDDIINGLAAVDLSGPPPQPGQQQPGEYSAFSDEDLGLVRMNDIRMKSVDWHWKYRIPAGKMTLIAGNGGDGKTQIMLRAAACYTTGGEWPAGEGTAPLGDVIILSAEDDPADTIKPRLMAAGADMSRVEMHTAKVRIQKAGKAPEVHPVDLQDIELWQEIFRRRPGTKLFIVDPLPSFLGRGVNDSKNNEFRAAVEPFISQVIAPRGVAMLVNTHLNKGLANQTPTHRILGSVAYVNLARSVYFVMRDPETPGRRFLIPDEKSNHAPDDLPSLAFSIDRKEFENPDNPGEVIETTAVEFEPDAVQVNVRDLMASAKESTGGGQPHIGQAADWLRQAIEAGGPIGSMFAAKLGDERMGRQWPAATLAHNEYSKACAVRNHWWRVYILKNKLGGSSRKYVTMSGKALWFFTLPTSTWPPSIQAIKDAASMDADLQGVGPTQGTSTNGVPY